MTLTELRYIVAVARERHFGRAARACFVSQPTLSVGVKKLEEELGVVLFERRAGDVVVTPAGEPIIQQARRVLEEADRIRLLAQQGMDPLAGELRVGAIYTVGPYLLPYVVPELRKLAPAMPLIIEENYTARLRERLKNGELDVIIVAQPFHEQGVLTWDVYDEPFRIVVPAEHPWASRDAVRSSELEGENLLLLGEGHCFREQVIEACPECVSGEAASGAPSRNNVEGTSLETIRQMVASGLGITVLPATSLDYPLARHDRALLADIPFKGRAPHRVITLAWRRSFPRAEAVRALRDAILACELPAVSYLDAPAPL
ncbi:MAG TPA: LysR substrate-binding domain-containing protein [Gammaproteobacteria bacterium]|nr:LysR substrate-binding domain-containing protein [Gammaproteobacteria bacterium]